MADDRLVAELGARLGDVDRALLGQQPGAEGGHRRLARQGEELPGRLADAGHRRGGPGGQAAIGRLDALGAQQLGDELAEDDRLAVGDEVGLARAALLGGQDQALDDVVDVGGVGDVAAAADPGEAARFDRRDHLRQQRRVALAPDEARAQGDGLEALARRRRTACSALALVAG